MQELVAEEATRIQAPEELVRSITSKTRKKNSRARFKDFTDINPEISAQLLKTWLRGEEENE